MCTLECSEHSSGEIGRCPSLQREYYELRVCDSCASTFEASHTECLRTAGFRGVLHIHQNHTCAPQGPLTHWDTLASHTRCHKLWCTSEYNPICWNMQLVLTCTVFSVNIGTPAVLVQERRCSSPFLWQGCCSPNRPLEEA